MYALKIRLLKQLNELVEKFDGKSVEEFVVALAKDTDIRLYREEGMLPCYSFYVITIPRGQGIVNVRDGDDPREVGYLLTLQAERIACAVVFLVVPSGSRDKVRHFPNRLQNPRSHHRMIFNPFVFLIRQFAGLTEYGIINGNFSKVVHGRRLYHISQKALRHP